MPSCSRELDANGGATSLDLRKRLAAKAYAATAAYDAMISQWFAFADQQQLFPDTLAITATRAEELRYGENPHQQAALYLPAGPHSRGIAQAEQVQGKALSYNNYNDADAALELVAEFRDGPPTVVIVKHANPCGVASGGDAWPRPMKPRSPATAFRRSAGSSRVNRPLDGATAEAISGIFTEVVVAPDADADARARVRQEEESAAAADRRAARSGARRAWPEEHRRRLSRPVARQWPDRSRPI